MKTTLTEEEKKDIKQKHEKKLKKQSSRTIIRKNGNTKF